MALEKQTGSRSFGMFAGVFVPTFLSIVGVILYLRLGYIVGSAGVFGTLFIILLAVSITFSTALSLSSITTTIRIGSGGAYSIISKTLGLEVGGSVGIPLYLAQTFSVALYILGFAETWAYIFPNHPLVLVALLAFLALASLTVVNTKMAVRAQVLVFVLVVISLISIFAAGNMEDFLYVPLVDNLPETSFWTLFAIFFPAVTGLMAGIGLSGELTDPKKQIPKGVLSALAITFVIYVVMTLWLGNNADPASLVENKLILAELAAFKPVVLAGILAATFSSALTTLVAAPRVLHALSQNSVFPFSQKLSEKTASGEPRNATIVTSVIIFFSLLIGSLDAIAQILTMFFLITYAVINVVVFIEQSLGLVSFRPTFNIPKLVPLYGAVGSVVIMFLINALAGLLAMVFLFTTYLILVKSKLEPKEGDVRSGLFLAISEWAAKKALTLESSKHTWKPHILLPVIKTRTLIGNFPLIKSISYPNGSLTVLGINLKGSRQNPEDENITGDEMENELNELPYYVQKFGQEGIFTSSSIVSVYDYTNGVTVSLEAIEGQVFHPNILFLPFNPNRLPQNSLEKIFETASRHQVGVVLFDRNEEMGLGSEEDIHVWIPPEVTKRDFYSERKFDLSLLIAYTLQRNWAGNISLWMCVDEKDRDNANYYLHKLIYEARFPSSTSIHVVTENFKQALTKAPQGDLHIIPVNEDQIDRILDVAKIGGKSFLFVSDSGQEDVLA